MMSNSVHSIKLRGPWQLSVYDHQEVCLFQQRVKVQVPTNWWAWLAEMELDQIAKVSSVVYQRKFNWPNPAPKPEAVSLVVCDASQLVRPGQFELNGEVLPHEFEAGECRPAVLDRLEPGNRLLVKYQSIDSSVLFELKEQLPGFEVSLAIS